MKVRVQDMNVEKKTVLLRCDFNVPIQNGKILDETKIVESLETINYLQEHDCKIVILSHLGKVKSEEDKLKNTLEPVALRLSQLLGNPVSFSKQCRNIGLWDKVKQMKEKDILLLENTRFEDYPQKLESSCDTQLSMYWAELGDVFVNDAFGSSHRVHASVAGIAKYLPSGIGFLVQKELDALTKYVLNPTHPFTVIMGGSKVDDKIQLIEAMLAKCDYLLLGGGIANGFLNALGLNPGFASDSMNPALLTKLREMMFKNKEKIMLPLDAIVSRSYDPSVTEHKLINNIDANDLIYDIGNKTIEKYSSVIKKSKTIFVNGTVGVYEDARFANGTKEILSLIAKSDADTVIGGGDSVSSVVKFGFGKSMTYLSSGGGASLEFIVNEKLDALDYIPESGEENEILDI